MVQLRYYAGEISDETPEHTIQPLVRAQRQYGTMPLVVLDLVSCVRGNFQFEGSYDMFHVADCVCEVALVSVLQRDTSPLEKSETFTDKLDATIRRLCENSYVA